MSVKSTLDDRIARAKVECANMACAQPHIWPEWQRLQSARTALENAQKELEAAQNSWNKLIEKADPKYKALLD